MNCRKPPRVTIDTNVIGAALKPGSAFRSHLHDKKCRAYVAETSLTLDGLFKHGKVDLLARRDVGHAFNKRRWDEFVSAGVTFLLCPRIALPRPTYTNEAGDRDVYTAKFKSDEHTYSQDDRLDRYSELARYIETNLAAGIEWLAEFEREIFQRGGQFNQQDAWYTNVARNIDTIGEKRFGKRFADWADADAIAAHYAYGNDIFCTDDAAGGAGSRSVLSAANRERLMREFGIEFRSLDDVCTIIA